MPDAVETRRAWVAWDAACVIAFVVIGRRTHHHGETLRGVARTAWPFLAGLAVGWLAAGRWRRRRLVAAGVVVAAATVALGMALRVVDGQGTAAAFIVVAVAFFSLAMVGARLAWRAILRARA